MGRQAVDMTPAARDAARVLGQQIRLARRDRNMTAAELAARSGASPRTIGAIERGSPSVSIGHVLNAAIAAGVPLFETTDPAELAQARRQGEKLIALIPQRVHHPRGDDAVLDF